MSAKRRPRSSREGHGQSHRSPELYPAPEAAATTRGDAPAARSEHSEPPAEPGPKHLSHREVCCDGPAALARIADQLRRFALAIYEPNDLIEVRRGAPRPNCSEWVRASELATIAARLLKANLAGQNVYAGINPRRRRGTGVSAEHCSDAKPCGKCEKCVELVRGIFADFDGVRPDEAIGIWRDKGLPEPTLGVVSGNGVHLYLRLRDPIDGPTFTRLQRDLAAHLGSDSAVTDPPRIMRLPGPWNLKDRSQPKSCHIFHEQRDSEADIGEVRRLLPPAPVTESTDGEPAEVDVTLEHLSRVASYARSWEGLKVSQDGGRHKRAFRHAAILTHEYGLSTEQAWPFLEAWNKKNSPPLVEEDLRRQLKYGKSHGKHETGTRPTPADQERGNRQDPPPTDSAPTNPTPWLTIAEIGRDGSYARGFPAVPTGFDNLDNQLRGGFRHGCLNIFAGTTGSAKSTLISNVARLTALSGQLVLLFKIEEPVREVVWRMHAAASQADIRHFLDGTAKQNIDRQALADGWGLIRSLPLRISGQRKLSEITAVTRRHAEQGGGLVIIDQLSQIDTPGNTSFERMTEASNGLRQLASDLEVPVLVVSQINREASKSSKKKNGRLTCHDLRETGHLENDAAAVVMIQAAERLERPDHGGPIDLVMELRLSVEKNRYGPITGPDASDFIRLNWWPRCCRIEDAAPLGAEEAL